MNDRILQLQKEIDTEKEKIKKCKICGNIEYTYEQKPIIKGFEPKF